MQVIERTIQHNNCIGCGACAFAYPDNYALNMSTAGHFVASSLKEDATTDASAICPMSGTAPDESEIANDLFPDLDHDEYVGRHLSTFASFVNSGSYRENGGSGGLVSWIANELLRRGLVDAIAHVKRVQNKSTGNILFDYEISYNTNEINEGSKSRYYPINMSKILREISTSGKRYALIGLPCFIKGIRLMQKNGTISKESIPFCIGLVCGHLKSQHFAGYLSWQKNIAPSTLLNFNFRHKMPGRTASNYGFSLLSSDAPDTLQGPWPMAEVRGRNWGEGQFKNPACEFCDDVLAECADVAIGDAWLPNFVSDYRGTNIVVTRNNIIDAIIKEGGHSGNLTNLPASVADVIRSQAAGLRHRREGLAHRLARRAASGEWAPLKRVKPALELKVSRRIIYDLRWKIAKESSQIFGEVILSGGSLQQYHWKMAKYLLTYKFIVRSSEILKKVKFFPQRIATRQPEP